MGLLERRAQRTFEEKDLPRLIAQVQAAATFGVAVTVDVASLYADGLTDRYAETVTKLYFEPLVAALRQITADDEGAAALKAMLTNIVVTNAGKYEDTRGIALHRGTLTFDHAVCNSHAVDYHASVITRLLSDAL